MTIVKTSVFQLEAPADDEPFANWAAIARRNSATMDAAMAQRVTPPGVPDLNAEIVARQALAARTSLLETAPTTLVRQAAAQSLGGGAWVLLTFGTVELDEFTAPDTSMWATATPNRLSARRAGLYEATGVVTGDVASAAWSIAARLSRNSNNSSTAGLLPSAQTRATVTASQYGGLVVSTKVRLAAGDHVQLWGVGSTTVNTVVGGDIASSLSLQWLRP